MFSRLLSAVFAVWGVVTIVFATTRFLGDPAALLLPVGATAAQIQALNAGLGLDQPLWVQYCLYIAHVMQGDFGQSFVMGGPALGHVFERLPATALLGATSLAIGICLGTAAGILMTVRPGVTRWFLHPLVLLAQATPTFWLGLLLVLVFAVQLNWMPSGGYGKASNLWLPSLTLGAFISASIARFLHTGLADVLHEDHVRTARALGLTSSAVFRWHVLRNGLVPVVSFVGIIAGELMGGAVVVETVFSWPGTGRLLVQAIGNKDFPVVQACVLVTSVLFVCASLIVDVLYRWLDPRSKLGRHHA